MVKKSDNPYRQVPPNGFWRSGVAEPGLFGFTDLWRSKWKLPRDARFSTYGSCFAQHISRALVAKRIHWLNAEPAPGRTPEALARKYNYGVFSARTGNIYTAAQLLKWVRLALAPEEKSHDVEYWMDQTGRAHDLLRPRIEPTGFASEREARASLSGTARAFARSIRDADVFVLTLGLTEGWINSRTGQTYSICPGTGIGTFDPEAHRFHNYTYPEILEDLQTAFETMWGINPDLHILLTVSPVPLVATASGDHVLVATQYSKSVLRAVAGDMANSHERIDYFPSYEIIASPPSRAMFFAPDMRSVAQQGVDFVMRHVFNGLDLSAPARHAKATGPAQIEKIKAEMNAEDLVCEEMILESQNAS